MRSVKVAAGGRSPHVGVVGDTADYSGRLHRLFRASGGMADALASGASVLRDVGVQVPLRPQKCVVSGHRAHVSWTAFSVWFVVGSPWSGRVDVRVIS